MLVTRYHLVSHGEWFRTCSASIQVYSVQIAVYREIADVYYCLNAQGEHRYGVFGSVTLIQDFALSSKLVKPS
jgi:hypothetical protein